MSDGTEEREERKRERAYDPVQRWKYIQETITWAEENLPPELRRNRPRRPSLTRSPARNGSSA
jgi:hypothetical protein